MAHLVTAVIKPHKLEEVKDALREAGVHGLSVSELQGYGRQGGKSETFRGSEYTVDFVPKVKLEVVVPPPTSTRSSTSSPRRPAPARSATARSGACPLDGVTRVRTGEKGDDAL